MLQNVIGSDFKATDVEIGVVSKENPFFKTLGESEVEDLLAIIADKDWFWGENEYLFSYLDKIRWNVKILFQKIVYFTKNTNNFVNLFNLSNIPHKYPEIRFAIIFWFERIFFLNRTLLEY